MHDKKQQSNISSSRKSQAKGRDSRGFTIIFAVLIGSIFLFLGIFIAHVSLKEIVLSAAGKQSETAFFAADTGTECALYWDFRIGGTFPKSSSESGRSSITCNGASVSVARASESTTAVTSTFTLNFTPKGCAVVRVEKTVAGSTVIESRGQNECGSEVNPSRVERALRVRY